MIRNSNDHHLTNRVMQYLRSDGALNDGPTVFKVSDLNGRFLISIADDAMNKALALTHGALVPYERNAVLEPGTQHKYVQWLDAQFSQDILVSGNYRVFATFTIPAWKIISPDGKTIRIDPWLVPPLPTTDPGEKRELVRLDVESAPVQFRIE